MITAFDPDPAGIRAVDKLLIRLPADTVNQFCKATPQVRQELIEETRQALNNDDIEEAWRTILEAKFVDRVNKLCPTTTRLERPAGIFDEQEIVSMDLVSDIGEGIRGIGASLSQLPIALIALAGAIVAGSIIWAMAQG